jgi:hypothetical protein
VTFSLAPGYGDVQPKASLWPEVTEAKHSRSVTVPARDALILELR